MRPKKRFLIELASLLIIISVSMFIFTPSGREFLKENPQYTPIMFERRRENEKILYRYTPLNKISKSLQRAVIVAEDSKFYEHSGFDFESINNAFFDAWKKKSFPRGASTITQQLAKNLYLSSEKSLLRKIKEALITFKIEYTLSKQKILELYCNIAEWGPGIFGAEAASQYYFKKSAATLTPYEAALLAAMLPSPNGIFDFKKYPNRVKKRASMITRRMFSGSISKIDN